MYVLRSAGHDTANYFYYVSLGLVWPLRILWQYTTNKLSVHNTSRAPQQPTLPLPIFRLQFERQATISNLGWFVVVALVVIVPFKVLATWGQINFTKNNIIKLATQAVHNLQAGGNAISAGQTKNAQIASVFW